MNKTGVLAVSSRQLESFRARRAISIRGRMMSLKLVFSFTILMTTFGITQCLLKKTSEPVWRCPVALQARCPFATRAPLTPSWQPALACHLLFLKPRKTLEFLRILCLLFAP
jgi:hypothetical protein